MKVQSNERPDRIQVIGNKTYLNLDIKDVSYEDDSGNEIVMFEYEQFTFPNPVSNDVVVKAEKDYLLESILVTTSAGNTFNGEDKSQGRMTSAILASKVLGKTSEEWKLADGTIKEVTLEELEEALTLSIQEVGRIVKEHK